MIGSVRKSTHCKQPQNCVSDQHSKAWPQHSYLLFCTEFCQARSCQYNIFLPAIAFAVPSIRMSTSQKPDLHSDNPASCSMGNPNLHCTTTLDLLAHTGMPTS